MRMVSVPVKSAWLSKINLLQLVTLTVTYLTGVEGALNLDPVTAAKLTALIAMGGQILTIVIRNYFTTQLTAGSVGRLAAVLAPVKSALASKINWVQIIALTVTFATGIVGAFNLDPATTGRLTAEVAMGGQFLTILVRTFFTTAVTTGSVGAG